MAGLNPLSTLLSLILSSVVIYGTKGWVAIALFIFIFAVPYLFGINTLKLLWAMKIMVITALLILVFALLSESSVIDAIAESARFLSLITLSAIYVTKSDLMLLSTTLSGILSPIFGKGGRKAASALLLTLSLFPLIFSSATEMSKARKSRGGSFLRHPVSSILDYTVSLMRVMFSKVIAFQDAMYSRAWRPEGERTPALFSLSDYTAMALSVLAFIGIMVWIR